MLVRLLLLFVQLGSFILILDRPNEFGTKPFGESQPSLSFLLLAIVATGLIAATLPSRVIKPSDALLWLFASLTVVPTLVYETVTSNHPYETRLTGILVVLLGYTLLRLLLLGSRKPLNTRTGLFDRYQFALLIGLVASIAIVLVYWGYGLSGFNLDLGNIYERRLAAREVQDPFPGANYIVAWLKVPIIPFLIVMGFYWKQWYMLLLAAFSSLLIFSFDGQRSALVIVLLTALIYWAQKRSLSGSKNPWIGIVVSGLVIAPILVDIFWSTDLVFEMVARLTINQGDLLNSHITYTDAYGFDFFSQYWSGFFGEKTIPVQLAVGEMIQPGSGLNATANMWADGYAAAGFVGVAINSIVFAIIARFADRLANARDPLCATVVLTVVLMTPTTGPLFRSLLSDGVLFALLLVWLMPGLDASKKAQEPGTTENLDTLKEGLLETKSDP